MLKPEDLFITESEFKDFVSQCEKDWLDRNNQLKPQDRETRVRFWVRISKKKVNPEHINSLKSEYEKYWDNVGFEWIKDDYSSSETLMITLSL